LSDVKPRQVGAPRKRILLRGAARAVETWAALFRAPSAEVVTAHAAETSGPQDVSIALAASAAEAAEAARAAGPLAIVVGEDADAHPFTRLLRDIVHAKRDCQKVLDAMLEPVAVLDRQGVVRRANLALAQATGCDVRELPTRHYRELIGVPAAGLPDPIQRGLETGKAEVREARFPALPGVRLVTTSPVLDEDGSQSGLVVGLRDISELKEQQQRLMQAARLADVGLLAAGVAHEINTPLASIGLRAESLLRTADDPRLQALDSFRNFPRYLKTIVEEVERCKNIVAALLEFSRSRRHELLPTDLGALLQRALELVQPEARSRGIRVELEPLPELPKVRCDAVQIRQVLLALLMNALEACGRGGRVSLSARHGAAERVALIVADDGVGIPEQNLSRLFSPFFTTKPVGQGTGLGLAICHGIVSAHAGEIQVSSSPGKGTRVTIELPLGGPVG
jgi:signal transduction histidine kinase